MKNVLFALFSLGILLSACTKTKIIKETYQIPIYQKSTEAEAEAGLRQEAPHQRNGFGNTYVYQTYLLINERGVGIHIYDNSDTLNPVPLSFINIPGNMDMAIQKNVLYADSYDDLLSLDISNIHQIQLMQRLDNVFPQYHPSVGRIIGYKDTTITYEQEVSNWPFTTYDDDSGTTFELANTGNQTGTAGSMARFTIAHSHLYAVDRSNLHTFSIINGSNVQKVNQQAINFFTEVETIFPFGDHLFLGSTDGIFIYDITNPSSPSYLSQFTHVRSCDPVYVSDSLAFVTLRSNTNNFCTGTTNQLDVLNIQQIDQPQLIRSFGMSSPHGLGVKDSLLFICEGNMGLKVYNFQKNYQNNRISNIQLTQKTWLKNVEAIDIIPLNDRIIVVGKDELNQYAYTIDGQLRHLSTLN